MEDNKIGRREFLAAGIKGIVIGSLALSSFDILKLVARDKHEESVEAAKTINISDYPELATAGGYAFITKNDIVIRVSKSKFLAINNICTHKKCEVDFDGSSFECPCHGSTYDKYGKVTNGPATKNLKSYKTTYNSDDDTLTINM
ncbi:MAG: ubiquinol-cytochrome c reductase iron-sulfur subunit [Bacteroidetes bacterium]|nr:ubiquinol-cytochrome c reductase iron-sulfur subunit [Bacteroidota bacterium]